MTEIPGPVSGILTSPNKCLNEKNSMKTKEAKDKTNKSSRNLPKLAREFTYRQKNLCGVKLSV